MGTPAFWALSTVCSCPQALIGFPSTETILSLGLSPATSAGDFPRLCPAHESLLTSAALLAGTQLAIELMVVVLGFNWPIPIARMNSRNNASPNCMQDPAASTMIRCQPGWFRNDRGSSA